MNVVIMFFLLTRYYLECSKINYYLLIEKRDIHIYISCSVMVVVGHDFLEPILVATPPVQSWLLVAMTNYRI